MQILVVEDEALIRMLVCDLLEEAGHTCIQAVDATEALILLDRGFCRPDVMVTDFNLGPGPDGQALAREALWRLPRLVVIFITGNPEAFDDYPLQSSERLVAKPFSGSDLIEALSSLRSPHQYGRFHAASAGNGATTKAVAELV
jgi:CheY-like chemotaxis protein